MAKAAATRSTRLLLLSLKWTVCLVWTESLMSCSGLSHWGCFARTRSTSRWDTNWLSGSCLWTKTRAVRRKQTPRYLPKRRRPQFTPTPWSVFLIVFVSFCRRRKALRAERRRRRKKTWRLIGEATRSLIGCSARCRDLKLIFYSRLQDSAVSVPGAGGAGLTEADTERSAAGFLG